MRLENRVGGCPDFPYCGWLGNPQVSRNTKGNHGVETVRLVSTYRAKSCIPGFLRWCEMDSQPSTVLPDQPRQPQTTKPSLTARGKKTKSKNRGVIVSLLVTSRKKVSGRSRASGCPRHIQPARYDFFDQRLKRKPGRKVGRTGS